MLEKLENLKKYKNLIEYFPTDFDLSPKRAVGNVGLFPFPRVGRSDPEMVQDWDSSFENYDGEKTIKFTVKNYFFKLRSRSSRNEETRFSGFSKSRQKWWI